MRDFYSCLLSFKHIVILVEQITTLKRNRNATLLQWKIHGVLFKVLDRDNEPSSFQEMLMNSTKNCLK